MRKYIEGVVTPSAMIILAMAVLILPLRWLLAWGIAALTHEFFHLAAVYACGGEVVQMRISPAGALMSATQLDRGRELLCALAGPVGALLLIPLAKWIPAVAICAVFQSMYNLLPLYPLDGGRALRCALLIFFSERTAQRVCDIIGVIVLVVIWSGALYGAIWLKLGIMPLLLALILNLKTKKGKIPCKPVLKWVQW
jgi:hypothetical protein